MNESDLVEQTLRSMYHDAVVKEERSTLALSLFDFVREGWPALRPEEEYVANWHLKVLCAYLEEVSAGNIKRLQIWFPRRSMKSYVTSIMWPAWEWTRNPGINYWTASFSLDLAMELATKSRDLILSPWYQERWGHVFGLTRVAEQRQENDRGGRRFVTARGSGALGRHGDRILIDDAINAQDADATSGIRLKETNEWYDAAVPGSLLRNAAIVNIQQRLHESDLAGHLMDLSEKTEIHWDILCLPERFEEDHPQAWRGERIPECIKARFEGTELENGDPRFEGDLLWPEFRDEAASNEMAISLTSFRAAGQLQQRPAAREGEILLRAWWRFYDPRHRGKPDKLPRFSRILISGDYPSKDKESNDLTAIQCWGVSGGDRYLLDLEKGHYNYLKALRRTQDMANWARSNWPRATHQILIENAGFGPELILDLKRRITGVQKINPQADGDKVMRAETASADLESGNCFLPGYGPPWQPAFDEASSPADICDMIHSFGVFPNGAHDDDVDAWSQAMNWIRLKQSAMPMRTSGLHHLATRR